MVLLPLEALLCFRERHARASRSRTEKQNTFSVFFLPPEVQFCFRKRHGCAFARSTYVPPGNGKENMFSFR